MMMKKSLRVSLFLLLSLLFLFAAGVSHAAISCSDVNVKAESCVTYAMGKAPKPAAACCGGLQQLARNAKTVDDRKAICRCLKAGVKSFAGVQDKYLSQIPGTCNIKVGFPVSLNTNCDTIK